MSEVNSNDRFTERRRFDRLGKKHLIRYGKFEELHESDSEKQGELIDIGGGGAKFMAAERYSVDTPLVLTIDFFGWSPDMDKWATSLDVAGLGVLKILGMVVRCSESEGAAGKFEICLRFSGSVQGVR